MQRKKLLFLLNPKAGQRRAATRLWEIIRTFSDNGWCSEVHVTCGPGDATTVVSQRAREFDRIICAGGDGTLSEVLNGLVQSGYDCPVGYIPAGTTNDFAATVGLSSHLLTAARDAATGDLFACDLGQFQDRNFAYIASFGAFTRASYSTPQVAKNALGHLAYLLEGVNEVFNLRTYPVRMETETGRIVEGDFLFGAISNSTSVGGLIRLSEDLVSMDDGQFEVVLIHPPQTPLQISKLLLAVTQGDFSCDLIEFFTASSLIITAPEDMYWTLDGERAKGSAQIRIQNLRKAIRLVVPAK